MICLNMILLLYSWVCIQTSTCTFFFGGGEGGGGGGGVCGGGGGGRRAGPCDNRGGGQGNLKVKNMEMLNDKCQGKASYYCTLGHWQGVAP